MIKKITDACYFATEKHTKQRRKNANKDPYINHPMEVMYILTECGITDVNTLCGALLHDTIEDTNTTKEEIISRFGEEVYNIVLECSDDKSFDKITRKRQQIKHSENISDKAKLVKLADKYSNIHGLLSDPPSEWSNEQITGYIRWGYVVCQKLYGVQGAESLDKLVQGLFEHINVSDVTDEQLEQYYRVIM